MRPETQESMPSDCVEMLRSFVPQVGPDVFERCGLVRINPLGGWHLIEIANLSFRPNEFVMGSEELLEVWRTYGEEIIGVWHTHPRGDRRPSDHDRQWAPGGMRYWIVTEWGVSEYDMRKNPPECVNYQGVSGRGPS